MIGGTRGVSAVALFEENTSLDLFAEDQVVGAEVVKIGKNITKSI